MSNKFFKEEFKFKVIVCSVIEELYGYVDNSELTVELGGTLPYFHQHWIQQRMVMCLLKQLLLFILYYSLIVFLDYLTYFKILFLYFFFSFLGSRKFFK